MIILYMCVAVLFAMLFFFPSKMQVLFVSIFFAKYCKICYIVCDCGFVLILNKCNAIYISILQWIDLWDVSTLRLLCMSFGEHMDAFLMLA